MAQASQYQEFCQFFDKNPRGTLGYNVMGVNVLEDYVMGISFTGCADGRDLNTRVPELVISAINNWHKIEGAKGPRPRFIML